MMELSIWEGKRLHFCGGCVCERDLFFLVNVAVHC
jgi:hypothetical protein